MRRGRPPTTTAAPATTLRTAIVTRTWRALRVASRARRSSHFSPSLRHSNSAGFRGQSRFRLCLGLIEFGFVFRFFVDFFRRRYINFFRRNCVRRKTAPGPRRQLPPRRRFPAPDARIVLTGCVRLFFEFLESCILFEIFDVVCQVGFFFFDLFFFQVPAADEGAAAVCGCSDARFPLDWLAALV